MDRIVRTALQGGEGPDIVMTPGPAYANEYIDANLFAELDEYSEQYKWDDKLLSWALELGRYEVQLAEVGCGDRPQPSGAAALSRLRELLQRVGAGQLRHDHVEQHYPDRGHHCGRMRHSRDGCLRDESAGSPRNRHGASVPVRGQRHPVPDLPGPAVLSLEYPAADEYSLRPYSHLLGSLLAVSDVAVTLVPGRLATRLRGRRPHRRGERALGAAPSRAAPQLARFLDHRSGKRYRDVERVLIRRHLYPGQQPQADHYQLLGLPEQLQHGLGSDERGRQNRNLPIIVLFLILQRRFISGLTAGGLKG
jgi:hypothetical protein